MVQVAAEGEELFVVSYPAVDGGGEEPHFQLVVHYAADACVGDECEVAVAKPQAVVEMNEMSYYLSKHRVMTIYTNPSPSPPCDMADEGISKPLG